MSQERRITRNATRRQGAGSIEQLPSGRHRARLPRGVGAGRTLGVYETEQEAKEALDAALETMGEVMREANTGIKLRDFATKVLDRRELDGVRDVQNERYRVKEHILSHRIAGLPVTDNSLSRSVIKAWSRDVQQKRGKISWRGAVQNGTVRSTGKRLSAETVKKIQLVLKLILDEAVEDGLLTSNPCDVLKSPRNERTHEPWTYLMLEEQQGLMTCPDIPEPDLLRIIFAVGTGLRQAEQWHLELADVHVDGDAPHVVVRYSTGRKATKSGKVRKVPLFGMGLDAARRWLELLPAYAPKNPLGLMWPTPSGARRQRSETYGFPEHLALADISRDVRWHDLRHTFGTSLVNGFWGPKWSLQEVAKVMGHSSVKVTERYAHVDDAVVNELAAKTNNIVPTASSTVALQPSTNPSHARPTAGRSGARRGHGQKRKEPAVTGSSQRSGADGTRTRGLRRDRPAL